MVTVVGGAGQEDSKCSCSSGIVKLHNKCTSKRKCFFSAVAAICNGCVFMDFNSPGGPVGRSVDLCEAGVQSNGLWLKTQGLSLCCL